MAAFQRSRRVRAAIVLAGLAMAAVLGWQVGLGRADRALYDLFSAIAPPAPSDEVVIVAIDERSLAEVGRWPWPRDVHADLVERISAQSPAAIGLDLLLSEPDPDPAVDRRLAAALQRSGRVVLPVFTVRLPGGVVQPMLPVAPLAAAARALGHVSVEADADGVVRSVFLREGQGGRWWEHFSVALLQVAGRPLPTLLPGRRAPPAAASDGGDAATWRRDHWMHIAFAGPGGSYRTVSAADVLHGDVPDGLFRNRVVLVGAASSGLGDVYPTPLTGHALYTPGVEVSANIAGDLLAGSGRLAALPWQSALFSLAALVLFVPVLWRFSPRRSLLQTAAVVPLVLAASALALYLGRLWLPPVAALVVMAGMYLVWNWHRLETATNFLDAEVSRLRQGDLLLPTADADAQQGVQYGAAQGDLVDRRVRALARAAHDLRALHRFVAAVLDSLPDIALVAAEDGQILLANQAAAGYFGQDAAALRGQDLSALLRQLLPQPGAELRDAQGRIHLARAAQGTECRDQRGAEFLLKAGPAADFGGAVRTWIVSLVDITQLRQAERKRDEALQFLWHDLRSPQAAVLALLELHAADPADLPAPELLSRIRRQVERTHALAEGFVQLARAESVALQREPVDLADVLLDAVDDCWSLARAGQIELHNALPEGAALVQGDRGLLTRAAVNLVHNAVKFSRPGTRVDCSLQRSADRWCLAVRDQGPGMAPAERERLFERFARGKEPRAEGVGLGLAFTRTVAERHGGQLVLDSTPGVGSEFRILLPADCKQS
ncbi:CHASE2 domain-containing protein [Xylophilus sp. GW821-FHT01B05]